MSELYRIKVKDSGGRDKSMGEYEGRALLLVNVASKCGYTPQYEGLEALHRKYGSRGLTVLAFPCNDFGGQEPGTLEEIKQFCRTTYGVSFEVLDKIQILGEGKHPLYQWLTSHAEPPGEVKWNFEKFLITRDGNVAARFASKVKPEDPELAEAVERVL
jgi:glutathione peroxidase